MKALGAVLLGLLACHSSQHDSVDGQGSSSNVDASCGGVAGCACEAGSDCESDVCGLTVDGASGSSSGACVDGSQVAYVSSTGTGGLPCSAAAPCGTVSEALTSNLPNISVSGSVMDNVAITAANAVSIYGADPDAGIAATVSGTDALTVSGAGANVFLADLTITGGAGSANGVTLSSPDATLGLFRCSVQDTLGYGISETGTNPNLFVTRSTIAANQSGGMNLSSGNFNVANNFIINNGTAGADVGGVYVGEDVMPGGVFEYNTVANNGIKAGVTAGVAGGVTCDGPADIVNSIVAMNKEGDVTTGSGSNFNVGNDCLLGDGVTEGSSFVGADPTNTLMFVSLGTDYHIQSGSVAIGKGKMDLIMVDVEGGSRPQQSPGPDQGAHELKQ